MSNTAIKTGGPSGLPYMGDKVTLIRDVLDLAADTDEYDWDEVCIAWEAIVSALRAAKSLLTDIEAMEEAGPGGHGADLQPLYGPFPDGCYENGVYIEWPNLTICCDELSRRLQRLKEKD